MIIKKLRLLLIVIPLISIWIEAKGQDSSSKLLFNYITIEEGLPNNKVNSIDMGPQWFYVVCHK